MKHNYATFLKSTALSIAIVLASCCAAQPAASFNVEQPADSIQQSKVTLSICNLWTGNLAEHRLDFTADHPGDPGWNYIYTKQERKKYSRYLTKYVSSGSDTLHFKEDFINLSAIDRLYTIIANVRAYTDSLRNGQAIAAIQLTYGFDTATNRVVLLYKPCFLTRGPEGDFTIDWKINIVDTTYYKENSATHLLIRCPEASKLIEQYIPSKMRTSTNVYYKKVKHPLQQPNAGQEDLLKRKDDVSSCIIPLQEILHVYLKAKKDSICTNTVGTDPLSFSFVASHFKRFKRRKTLHVAIFPIQLGEKIYENVDEGGDFGGMNPPYSTTMDILNYKK